MTMDTRARASCFRPHSSALALEPRILFDGAAAVAVDNHNADNTAGNDHAASSEHSTTTEPVTPTTPAQTAGKALLVIDSRVENREQLLAALPSNVTALVVSNGQDGLAAISAALAQLGQVDSVQIVSHGATGQFTLGSTTLRADNVDSFSQALQGWRANLSDSADIQLYGCNVGAGSSGQALVNQLAELTGADVAASSDNTGAANKGGNWTLETRHGDIDKSIALSGVALAGYDALLADAAPTVTLSSGGSDVLLGDQFGFTVNFTNSAPQPGYAPFITLFLPASGKDSDDGVSFISASYLGQTLNSSVVTFDPSGNALHPVIKGPDGTPLAITASAYGLQAGDQLVIIRLPFASVTPDQPAISVQVTASLSNLADTSFSNGSPDLTIRASGGFELGNDALDNPFDDPALVQAATQSFVVHPTVITVTQTINTPEGETVSGPNYGRTMTVTVTPAPGQTLTNVVITQPLPDNIQVTAITPGAGGTLTSLTLADGTVLSNASAIAAAIASDSVFIKSFSVTYSSLSGPTDSSVAFYVPEADASGNNVINPITGDETTINIGAPTATGEWVPLDPRDITAPATHIDFSGTGDTSSFVAKSIALLKQVTLQTDIGQTGLTPGDTLRYNLTISVSDYFAFGKDFFGDGALTVTDQLGDGQTLSGTPTLTVSLASGTQTIALVTVSTLNADGSTTLQFDIAQSLQNAFGVRGWLNGDLSLEDNRDGAAIAVISYLALVSQSYTPPAGNPHSEINEGDALGNNAEVRGTLLEGLFNLTGSDQADSSSASSTIPTRTIDIQLLTVNGSSVPANAELRPGDLVTFSLNYDLVTGDYEQLKLTAYLPLPLFDVSSISAWGTGGGVGQWQEGSGDTNAGAVVSVTSGAGNSVVFDLGSFATSDTNGSQIRLQFTVRVGDQPFADQRHLDVLAQSTQQTTLTNVTLTSSDVVAIISVAEPVLAIAHGVVSASNGTVSNTTGSWKAPGSGGVPFNGSVTSLAAVDGDVTGIDGADRLRLATAIENSGGGGAFDVRTSIVLPNGLSFVGGSLANANLQIYRGDGTQLVAGVDYSVSGNQVSFLDNGGQATLLAGRAGTAADSSGANLVVISYDVLVDANIAASKTLESSASLTNYASVDGGSDFTPTDLSDTASQQVAAPEIRKTFAGGSLDASDSSASHTTGSDLVVGESMRYDIIITLPEGSTQTLRVDDLIPPGMRLDSSFNGGLGYQLITTTAGSAALASDFAGSVTVSGIAGQSGTLGNDGVDARLTFSAAGATADNLTGNNSFVIRLQLVASNVASNQANISLQNNAQLLYSDPDTDTANGSTASDRSVVLSGGQPTVTVREPTLQISQVLTSTSSPAGYDEGDPLSFTITISNGSGGTDFDAFDISFADTLPTELNGLTLVSVTYAGGATNNGGADFEIVGGQLRSVSGANIDIAKGGSIVLRVSGTVNASAAAEANFGNVATVQWTSLNGSQSGERSGVDGPLNGGTLNDYQRSSTLLVPVAQAIEISRVGGMPDTPAPSPTDASQEQVAIGEVVRYRVVVLIPEGSNTNYQLQVVLDDGLTFIDPSTVRLAFVSNAGGLSSDTVLTTGGTLNVTGNQNSAIALPITANLSGAAPTGVLDPSKAVVSVVGGKQVVTFSLGTLTNADLNDADLEGLVLEFNVRVANQTSNIAGAQLGVVAHEFVNGLARASSDTLYETVVEPRFSNLDKHITSFNPNPAGSSGTATVQISFNQDGGMPAYDTHLADGFSGGSNYTLLSVQINGSVYGPGNLPAGVTASTAGGISVDFGKLDVGAQVKVLYQVTLPNSAAIASSDATLTWTSLPETFTSWGGSSVGSDSSVDGERTGINSGPNSYIRSEGAGLGVVAGTLWNDTASATNSITPDGGGLAGLAVTLTWAGLDGDLSTTADNLQFSTVTDSNGQYRFALLPAGIFRIDVPAGTVSYPEPLGDLRVRIDTDSSLPLGQVRITLGEGATAAADAGYVEQNAAPINTLPGTQNGSEDVPLAIGGISVADIDADRDPNSADRQLQVTLSVLHGTLSLTANPQSAGVSGSGTATLILTGTQAQLNAALANLSYLGNLNYNGSDTLKVETNDQGNFGDADGDGIPGESVDDARSDTDSLQINLVAVNDNPIANNDSANAVEAGGSNNRLPGVDPRGNLLSNDTDVDIATNADQLRVITVGLGGQAQVALPSIGSRVITGQYGSLVVSLTGAYQYIVDNSNAAVQALRLAGQTLTESFDYTLSDLSGAHASATLTVTIAGANDTPLAVNDSGTATEAGGVLNGTPGSDATGNVLSNDSDPDSAANGETQTVTGIRAAPAIAQSTFFPVPNGGSYTLAGQYGTLTINANGTYTYVVDNSNATVQRLVVGTSLKDTFSYRLTDTGDSNGRLDAVAELNITINGAYDNPVASNDLASAQAAPTDDSSLESNPTGNVILYPSRPGTTDNGIDSDVDAPDQPNSQLQVNGVINKTEASYDPLNDVLSPVGSALAGQYGSLTLNADGSYSYNVDSNNVLVQGLQAGQTLLETFTYRVVDTAGRTDTAQLTITVHGVNDPPVAQNAFAIATEAGGLNNTSAGVNPSGDVTRNATDPDGDPLTVTFARPGALADNGTDLAISAGGTTLTGTYGSLLLHSDGSYSYSVDNANAAVQALRLSSQLLIERFTYTINDGNGRTDQAEIVVVIRGQNDNPLATDDSANAVEAGGSNNGTPGSDPTGNVLSNDSDVDGGETQADISAGYTYGETRTVASVRTGNEGTFGTSGTLGVELRGTYGWLTLQANGDYSYRVDNSLAAVQALRGSGNTLNDSFNYSVADASNAQDTATLTITLHGANDAPVAVNDTAVAVEAGGVNNATPGSNPTGNVLTNDTDVDAFGESVRVIGVSHGASTGSLGSSLLGSYGSLILNADGSYSYVLDNSNAAVQALRGSANTLRETFNYRISDLAGATSSALLTITIQGRNDNPVAVDDNASASEAGGTFNGTPGSNASGNVLNNDTDVDAGDGKVVDGIYLGSEIQRAPFQAVGTSQVIVGRFGQLTINANGSFSYVIDNSLAAVQALKPGDTLLERFTYRMHDSAGATDAAQLDITLRGAWDAPVAADDIGYAVAASTTSNGLAAVGNVLRNDSDVDANDVKSVTGIRSGNEAQGGALSNVAAGTSSANGTLISGLYGQLLIGADGSASYRVDSSNPAVIALGPLEILRDVFTYQVKDGGSLSDLAQITIIVRGGDQAPVAVDDSNVASDQTPAPQAQGNVLPNDSDIDLDDRFNEHLTVTAIRTGNETGSGVDGVVGQVIQGLYGSLVLNADGSYTYSIDLNNPDVLRAAGAGQVLHDVFTYTVADFWGASDTAELVIHLDIAAPYVAPSDDGDAGNFYDNGASNGNASYQLPGYEPAVFVGPVVENQSSLDELASWKVDGSNIDLVRTEEIRSTTLLARLSEVKGQFVKAAVQQSSRDSALDLAWILGRQGRISLSAEGLLGDPSVFAPLPADMLQGPVDIHPDQDHGKPQQAPAKPPAAGPSAKGFSAQLQAAAHRLPQANRPAP